MKYKTIFEIAQYMYDGFTVYQECGTVEKIAEMIDRNSHHTIYIREKGAIVGVAVYFMLTDLTLVKIQNHTIDLKDPEIFRQIEKEEGHNMHIFNIRADRMSLILNGLRGVMKNLKPKTISYYKDDELENLRMIKCRKY